MTTKKVRMIVDSPIFKCDILIPYSVALSYSKKIKKWWKHIKCRYPATYEKARLKVEFQHEKCST